MKTLDRFKAIAVSGLVILLALNFVFVSVELIKDVEDQEIQYIPRKILFRTVELEAKEEVVCADFGSDIIRVIESNEDARVKFFAELTESFTKGFTVKVLSIGIDENKDLCIRYILDINKQNPKGTFLARWVP